jgi:hypothetical protein
LEQPTWSILLEVSATPPSVVRFVNNDKIMPT